MVRIPKKSILIMAVSAVLVALGVLTGMGVAVLAQNGDDTIHGCVGGNGNLRVIDDADTCKKNETALNWNKEGPPGPEPDSIDWGNVTNKPAGFADGVDDDTPPRTEVEVEAFITNDALDLNSSTTIGGASIAEESELAELQDKLDNLLGRVAYLEGFHPPQPEPLVQENVTHPILN